MKTPEDLWVNQGRWNFLSKDYELKTNCSVSLEDDAAKEIKFKRSGIQDHRAWIWPFYLPKPVKDLIDA